MSKKIMYRDIKQLRNKQPAEYAPIKEQEELTPLDWLHYYERIVRESHQTFRPNGLEVIETALKALAIIKTKRVDVSALFISDTLQEYNADYGNKKWKLTRKEYDFLKEILK